jgi:hypothetical protein
MKVLARWPLQHGGNQRTIELLHGDLSHIPPEHAVDVLVVSAFPNNYTPTQISLIGSLARRGLSVAQLSENKKADLREQFSCWLSHPVEGKFGFRQVLCVESGWHGPPPDITDDVFRAIAPYLLTDFPNATVAMPVLGTGEQGWPVPQMMEAILTAANAWIRRGLPLKLLKIVVYSLANADPALQKFREIQNLSSETEKGPDRMAGQPMGPSLGNAPCYYDVFLSYCRSDSRAAELMVKSLQEVSPKIQIFHDRISLKTGGSWLVHIAESLDAARHVVALYSAEYWKSRYCMDEFTAALTRQLDTGEHILFPIYFHSAEIPYLFRNIQYIDCRERDETKLAEASRALAGSLS